MPLITRFEHRLGSFLIRYVAPADNPDAIGLSIIPLSKEKELITPREYLDSPAVTSLPAHWLPIQAWEVDPLIHVRRRDEPATGFFSQGRTLRISPTTQLLRLVNQVITQDGDTTMIRTTVSDGGSLECVHSLSHCAGDTGLRVSTTVRNVGNESVTLEQVTAFSLGGITPFAADDAPERLHLHRFRATWSAEGRHEVRSLEELQLERSWTGHGVACERFGAVGSMPVSGWHPLAVLEDSVAGVSWGAYLSTPGSWQLEVFRRADQVAFSGGHADWELGHWCQTLTSGAELNTPEVWLITVVGGVEEACAALTAMVETSNSSPVPVVEQDFPVVFNEWCTSWGNPTHDNLLALADKLKGSGVRYVVIDDGWAERPGKGIQQNGDWIVNRRAFPEGLAATARALRERGFIPGIWFEFEVLNPGSQAWDQTSHVLHRHGQPLQVGSRRFWDFRDPWVHEYLYLKVICLLRDNDLGYLKVDYNDTIGLGCDGGDSLGSALHDHLRGVQRFFRRLREALPELVIENCSSGGHRLEPSMLSLTSMSSFSDAHETPDIPIIAANTLRLVGVRHNQIWAVLRAADSRQRLAYSLAATFLGRMCLSGEIHQLAEEQLSLMREAIALYREAVPFLKAGRVWRGGTFGKSYQHPTGWQVLRFDAMDDSGCMIVWHSFADAPSEISVPLPVGKNWKITRDWSDEKNRGVIQSSHFLRSGIKPWSGGVVLVRSE